MILQFAAMGELLSPDFGPGGRVLEVLPVPGGGDAVLSVPGVVVVVGEVIHQVE